MIIVHYYVEKMPHILQRLKRDGEHRFCHSQGTMDSPKASTLHLLSFSPQKPGLDHPSHAAQLVLRAAAAGHTDSCGGQRMERASLAGLSSCTPAQAGNKASAHLTAEQESDPVLEPLGLQSSPFLILPPAQPRGMQSRLALAAATARGCFARPPSKAEVLLEHPQLPPQPPPGQQDSASC